MKKFMKDMFQQAEYDWQKHRKTSLPFTWTKTHEESPSMVESKHKQQRHQHHQQQQQHSSSTCTRTHSSSCRNLPLPTSTSYRHQQYHINNNSRFHYGDEQIQARPNLLVSTHHSAPCRCSLSSFPTGGIDAYSKNNKISFSTDLDRVNKLDRHGYPLSKERKLSCSCPSCETVACYKTKK